MGKAINDWKRDPFEYAPSGKEAQSDFEDFLLSFPEGIFVSIFIYADESGTHDQTGQRIGSEVATICGYAGWRTNWARFERQWKHHLKSEGVEIFHAYDLKDSRHHPEKYPCYRGWNDRRKDAFVLALAKIASKNALCPVGGNFATGWTHDERVRDGKPPEYPYQHCFDLFFISVLEELKRVVPDYQDSIFFFFDRNQNPEWKQALKDSYAKHSQTGSRFDTADPVSGNKKFITPLQAADLIAYETRKVALKAWGEAKQLGIRQPKPQPMCGELMEVLYRKMPNSRPGLEWVKKPAKTPRK